MSQFKCTQEKEKHIIKIPASFTAEFAAAFQGESQAWLLLPAEVHVLDFDGVLVVDQATYAPVLQFSRLLRSSGKQFRSINMSKTILNQIKAHGLKDAFQPLEPGSAPAAAAPAPGKMDVRFINPFLNSVASVFKTQAQTTLRPGKPFLRNEKTTIDIGIIGLISLNSTQFKGNIGLCFPTQVFLNVYERMLGEKHSEITQEIEDAVAELLNIIYGAAKTELNKDFGFDLQPALPTVLRGEKLEMRMQNRNPIIVLPFEADVGAFHVEIATEPMTHKRSA